MKALIMFLLVLSQTVFAQSAYKSSFNYHNRNCEGGVGFCSDSETNSTNVNPEVNFKFNNAKELTMTFAKSTLSPKELKELTQAKFFTVSGTNSLSLTMEKSVNKDAPPETARIVSGNYLFKIEKDSIKVYFPINEKR